MQSHPSPVTFVRLRDVAPVSRMKASKRHILIGISGGSGSGKTLVSSRIAEELGAGRVAVIQQDAYYKDLSHLTLEERAEINFDHPDAFDVDLLCEHLRALVAGEAVEVPVYDYVNHNRRAESITVKDHSIVVLEGILVFYFERIRELLDIKIFVDTPADIRLLRRLRRDILNRGRSVEGVLDQYEKAVRPMHMSFCEPTKRHADLIIPRGGENSVAIDIVRAKIGDLLRKNPTGAEREGESAAG